MTCEHHQKKKKKNSQKLEDWRTWSAVDDGRVRAYLTLERLQTFLDGVHHGGVQQVATDLGDDLCVYGPGLGGGDDGSMRTSWRNAGGTGTSDCTGLTFHYDAVLEDETPPR